MQLFGLCWAYLRGTNLGPTTLAGTNLSGTLYDDYTRWPIGSDPEAADGFFGFLSSCDGQA
jgi:hypothetical protein